MNKVLYTSSKIERCSELRTNSLFLNNIFKSKNSKFVPVWDTKNLFIKNNEDIDALIINRVDLELIISNISLENLIFLGKVNDIFYFSINLCEKLNHIPSYINKKEIFCEELRFYGSFLGELESSLLALAKGMTFWHLKNNYCSVCGSKNKTAEAGFVLKCSNKSCNTSHFPRTDPAIITLVSYKEEILLGRSSRFPEKMYSTLAGFVEPGETLEQAVQREVFEESGVRIKNIAYFGSQPWPFPASLMLGFFAEADNQDLRIDYNEIEDAHWFRLEHLKELKHPKIIDGFKLPRVDSIARRLVNHWMKKVEKK